MRLLIFQLIVQECSVRPVGQRVLHVADCRVLVLSKKDEVEMECGLKVELEVTHQVTVRMNET